jgi:hypothetical protein
MKKKWNPNDFQGKSKISVETSYRIVAFCLVIVTIVTTWVLVYEIIKMIF